MEYSPRQKNACSELATEQGRMGNYSHSTSDFQERQDFFTGIKYLGDKTFQFVGFERGGIPFWDDRRYGVDENWTVFQIKEKLERFFYPYITHAHRAVVSFVVDRTLGWQKLSERIRISHFQKGIHNVTGGCGLRSRSNIHKALKDVMASGWVRVLDGRFYVDFDTINSWVELQGVGIVALRDSKQGKDRSSKRRTDSVQNGEEKCTESVLYKRNTNEKEQKKPSASSSIPSGLELLKINEQKISSSYEERLNFNLRRPVTGEWDRDMLIKYWEREARKAYPQCLHEGITGKVKGQLAHFIKNTKFPKNYSVVTFLDFCLKKWHAIGHQHFTWINFGRQDKQKPEIHYPEYPSLAFLMSFSKYFLNAYQRDGLDELSPDYLYRKRLKQEGYDDQTIEEAIKTRLFEREQYEKGRQSIEHQQKVLDIKTRELSRKEREHRQRASLQTSANIHIKEEPHKIPEEPKEFKRCPAPGTILPFAQPMSSAKPVEENKVKYDEVEWRKAAQDIADKYPDKVTFDKVWEDLQLWIGLFEDPYLIEVYYKTI